MRYILSLLVVVVAVRAEAAMPVRGGTSGRSGFRSGLSLGYSGHSSHSSFSAGFRSGSWSRASSGRVFPPGVGGSVYGPSGWGWSSGGASVYRGWAPCSPWLYGGVGVYPWSWGVGPFTYVDSVVFTGPAAVPFVAYAPPALEGPAAPGRGPVPAPPAPAEYERLSPGRLVDLGDDFFVRGDFARAVEAYRVAARKGPEDPMAAFALGHGLFATGAYAEAAAELCRGLRLYPGIVQVRMSRRAFYGNPAAFDEQLGRLAARVEAAPADSAARFLLGYNCFFTQDYARARALFAALGAQVTEAQLFLREIARRE